MAPDASDAATASASIDGGHEDSKRQATAGGTINELQSSEQHELLNEIDKLRAFGVSEFVALPQLVVCGDQSSGKSSVLEAITELPFPRKDALCTRFATQIQLRKSRTPKIFVKIIPDSKASDERKEKLSGFQKTFEDLNRLADLIEEAKEFMGIDGGQGVFSKDILSIEVFGPNQPQLTVVDLPGLIHSSKSQSNVDVQMVSELVAHYMADKRTIVLAVISAKNDYANQVVLSEARKADPTGSRTLGIITKPDTLSPGSESEGEFIELAKNKVYTFLGWHCLRNRNFEERNSSFEERNFVEAAFFSRGSWPELPSSSMGIVALRSRLSVLLLNHIKKELPTLAKEILAAHKDCKSKLEKLGESRATFQEQQMYLLKVAEQFGHICKAAVDGFYDGHNFFTDAPFGSSEHRRLRAFVQYLNTSFADTMRIRGHFLEISEPAFAATQDGRPKKVTRRDAVEWVRPYLARSRGRELPGTFNAQLVGDLFQHQSAGWELIAKRQLFNIMEVCYMFLKELFAHLLPEDIASNLFSCHVEGFMKERYRKAMAELEELLRDSKRHPQTQNHYYTENVQKIRVDRIKRLVQEKAEWLKDGKATFDINSLAMLLTSSNEPNMDNMACEEALDSMMAYYKVALKTFVDNVATVVVERQVIGDLWDCLSPSSVLKMDANTIDAIAGEPEDLVTEREHLESKFKSLEHGLQICDRALRGIGKRLPISMIESTFALDGQDNHKTSLGIENENPFGSSLDSMVKKHAGFFGTRKNTQSLFSNKSNGMFSNNKPFVETAQNSLPRKPQQPHKQ